MTREEAKEFIAQSVKSDVDIAKVADAIKAIEQEPTTKNNLGVDKTDMIDKSNFSQEQYKVDLQSAYDCGYEQAKNDLGVDCVSRAYLLDDSKYHTVFNDDTGNFEDVVYREDIEKAPSVAPQLKIGHWIFDGDCLICSKCKKAYTFSGSNYCPNCGADMRGEEE